MLLTGPVPEVVAPLIDLNDLQGFPQYSADYGAVRYISKTDPTLLIHIDGHQTSQQYAGAIKWFQQHDDHTAVCYEYRGCDVAVFSINNREFAHSPRNQNTLSAIVHGSDAVFALNSSAQSYIVTYDATCAVTVAVLPTFYDDIKLFNCGPQIRARCVRENIADELIIEKDRFLLAKSSKAIIGVYNCSCRYGPLICDGPNLYTRYWNPNLFRFMPRDFRRRVLAARAFIKLPLELIETIVVFLFEAERMID